MKQSIETKIQKLASRVGFLPVDSEGFIRGTALLGFIKLAQEEHGLPDIFLEKQIDDFMSHYGVGTKGASPGKGKPKFLSEDEVTLHKAHTRSFIERFPYKVEGTIGEIVSLLGSIPGIATISTSPGNERNQWKTHVQVVLSEEGFISVQNIFSILCDKWDEAYGQNQRMPTPYLTQTTKPSIVTRRYQFSCIFSHVAHSNEIRDNYMLMFRAAVKAVAEGQTG